MNFKLILNVINFVNFIDLIKSIVKSCASTVEMLKNFVNEKKNVDTIVVNKLLYYSIIGL